MKSKFILGADIEDKNYNPVYFVLKSLIFFWVGLFLGNVVEKYSNVIQQKSNSKYLGQLCQLLFCIVIFLVGFETAKLHTRDFTLELQNSLAGLFFVAAFFNSQPSLISRFTLQ